MSQSKEVAQITEKEDHSILNDTVYKYGEKQRTFRKVLYKWTEKHGGNAAEFEFCRPDTADVLAPTEDFKFDRARFFLEGRLELVKKGYFSVAQMTKMKEDGLVHDLVDGDWYENCCKKDKLRLNTINREITEVCINYLEKGAPKNNLELFEDALQDGALNLLDGRTRFLKPLKPNKNSLWLERRKWEDERNVQLLHSTVEANATPVRLLPKNLSAGEHKYEPCTMKDNNGSLYLMCKHCFCPINYHSSSNADTIRKFGRHQCMAKWQVNKWVEKEETEFLLMCHLPDLKYDYSEYHWRYWCHNPRGFFSGFEPLMKTDSRLWSGPNMHKMFSDLELPEHGLPMKFGKGNKQLLPQREPVDYGASKSCMGAYYVFTSLAQRDRLGPTFPVYVGTDDYTYPQETGTMVSTSSACKRPGNDNTPVKLPQKRRSPEKELPKLVEEPAKRKTRTVRKRDLKAAEKSAVTEEAKVEEKTPLPADSNTEDLPDEYDDNIFVIEGPQLKAHKVHDMDAATKKLMEIVTMNLAEVNETQAKLNEEDRIVTKEGDKLHSPPKSSSDEDKVELEVPILEEREEDQVMEEEPEEEAEEQCELQSSQKSRGILSQAAERLMESLQEENDELKQRLKDLEEKYIDRIDALQNRPPEVEVVFRDKQDTLDRLVDLSAEIKNLKDSLALEKAKNNQLEKDKFTIQDQKKDLEKTIEKMKKETLKNKERQEKIVNCTQRMDDENQKKIREASEIITTLVNLIVQNTALGISDTHNTMETFEMFTGICKQVMVAECRGLITSEVGKAYQIHYDRVELKDRQFKKKVFKIDEEKETKSVSVVNTDVKGEN